MSIFRKLASDFHEGLSPAGTGRFSAAGLPVACAHCRHDTFESREAQMNTVSSSLMGLDALNRSGIALICHRCRLIQWFDGMPDRVADAVPPPSE